jgi:release factor glutamine methyltransferase
MYHNKVEQLNQHQQPLPQNNREIYRVSGKELFLWREQSAFAAKVTSISSKELDLLLQEVTDLDNLSLRLNSFRDRPEIILSKSLSELSQLWQQRLQEYIPLQYLLGSVFWRHFKLKVTPAVLIPRPETELIIDIIAEAVKKLPQTPDNPENWVDLGTGSGAIALGLVDRFPNIMLHAVDYSEAALAVARENAVNLGLSERINFYRGSWWNPLTSLAGKIRVMVANPPYIPSQELATLQPEVVKHEPHLALDGGADGLEAIRYLVDSAPNYLSPGGIWLIEMMAGQGALVKEILENRGSYDNIQIINDLAGIDRFVLAYRR